MVPSVLSEDLHRRIKGSELIIYPDSGHGGIFQFHDEVRPRRRRVPRPLTAATAPRRCEMSTSASEAQVNVRKHFSSSILLWMRTDQPRQTGMDYWKGPHSKIISATPGLEEYRQIHLAEATPGLWPADPRRRDRHPRRTQDRRRRGGHVPFAPVPTAGPQADPARVQGRDQRLPAHLAVRRSAELVPLVRGGRARREGGRPSPDLPPTEGWRRCRRVPEAHQQRSSCPPS